MQYELLYIVSAHYPDTEIDGIRDKVQKLIETANGTIVRSENLGKLRLAYPIKHQKHGSYILVQFDAETEGMQKLDNDLRLMEEVLRHMITERVAGAEKVVFELESYEAPLNPEGQRRGGQKKRPAPSVQAPAPIAGAADVEPMSMEELDKKLDKILEGTSEKI